MQMNRKRNGAVALESRGQDWHGGNPFSARWRGNPVFPIARTVSFQTASGALAKLIRGHINSNPIQAATLHRVQEILFFSCKT